MRILPPEPRFEYGYTFGGETAPAKYWCKKYGLNIVHFKRICVGRGIHPAEARKLMPKKHAHVVDGKIMSVAQAAQENQISQYTLYTRMRKGMSLEEAVHYER